MASTSAAETSSATKEPPNWLKMPEELMVNIFHRLRTSEILNSAMKVCTPWRRICKDPALWMVIEMIKPVDDWARDYTIETLTKQAVHLSCGELIDFSIEGFGTDDLLDHVLLRSNKLNRLCLTNCYNMTSSGLSQAVKKVPRLEKLHLTYISTKAEDIEVIGRNCPQLKSFMLAKEYFSEAFIESDKDALAIANSMPEFRHLQLSNSNITNDGLQAILDGCHYLESLDVRMCYNLDLHGNLGELCMERIKDFKHDSTDNSRIHPQLHDYDYLDDLDFPRRSYVDDYSEGESLEDLIRQLEYEGIVRYRRFR
ncbi:unnamed protein product [Lactuca virosa]|uniref:F-box domain-containing protein n=1 Tax=Lactuca virosa TaxID=75947 RepID=A0AAU9PEF4_9ASTR|nr:unnamed protein product [Lactuca virosa]